ncbi:MAG: hypothetical protein IPO21_02945 [Bacteroidales bacterium]|nr:hypothetical protein [Bacteroidales bacterium]
MNIYQQFHCLQACSDQAYAYLDGEDSYPEIAIGRFSGKTAEDIKIQADKVLKYEKLSVSESKSYNRYLMVGSGSENGVGDNAEYDYEHLINIKNKLKTVSYKEVLSL